MTANSSGRTLECECGYVAHGEDDDELVAVVQAHAHEVHGMTLSADLILALADTKDIRRTDGQGEPEETTVSLGTKQWLQ